MTRFTEKVEVSVKRDANQIKKKEPRMVSPAIINGNPAATTEPNTKIIRSSVSGSATASALVRSPSITWLISEVIGPQPAT